MTPVTRVTEPFAAQQQQQQPADTRSIVICGQAPAPAAAFLGKGKGRMGGKRSRTVAWKTHRTAKEKQLFRPDPAPWAALTHPWDSPVGGRGVLDLCAERQPLIAAGGHHHGTAGRARGMHRGDPPARMIWRSCKLSES